MVTSRDIEEIISKLSSDKVKTREEGIKLLSTWLEGERSIRFCSFLSQNTAKLKPNEIPDSKTWPFLIKVLVGCISSEVATSKRRPPKPIFAKTLRICIQQAEDTKYSGKRQLLQPVVKSLFNHISDVLRDVPSFQSEYGSILRHLLAVKDYRFHMRKKVYCGLVLLYLGKVETSLNGKNNVQSNLKEELFRCILTLHSLIENPPGDYPDNLRQDIAKGFVGIFLHIRDEGKISRKLIECVNIYLRLDGPNLDCKPMEMHSALQEFVFRNWFTTHDRVLKDALVLYATLQLKLIRSAADGNHLVEQLLDVVCKDIDQSNIPSSTITWDDTAGCDRLGTFTTSNCGLLELAASVFYWTCSETTKASPSEKRPRREHAASRLSQGLMKGKWLWNAAFCFFMRNYHSRVRKDLIIYWFEAICESFERILNNGNSEHSHDGVLWMLRSLQELCSVRLLSILREDTSHCPSLTQDEFCGRWNKIWSFLIHELPIFSNVTSVADAALMLLGNIIANELVNIPIVPHDVWDLRLFKHILSVPALYFIACYFSKKASQGDIRDILHLRQNLLRSVLGQLNSKESFVLNERVIMLLPAAIFSLCAGYAPFPQLVKSPFISCFRNDVCETVEDWFMVEEHDRELLYQPVECSIEVLAKIKQISSIEMVLQSARPNVRLPRQIWQPLLHELETLFFSVVMDHEIEKMVLYDLFFLGALLCNCIHGSFLTRLMKGNSSFINKLQEHLLRLLRHAVSVIEENNRGLQSHVCFGSSSIFDGTRPILVSLRGLVCSPLFSGWETKNLFSDVLSGDIIQIIEKLLRALGLLYEQFSEGARNSQPETAVPELFSASETFPELDDDNTRILDMELDVNDGSREVDIVGNRRKGISVTHLSSVKWKFDVISAITSFFSILPTFTWEIMFDLMQKENDSEVYEYIIWNLCKHLPCSSIAKLPDLVYLMNNMIEVRGSLKLSCVNILTAIRCLLGTLVSSDSGAKDRSVRLSSLQRPSEQSLESLRDLVIKIAELDLLDWPARVKLIDCICDFIILDPSIGQVMIEKLLTMLQDIDYRVRLFLARRIGVLFKTWDGHDELFQDICSNFGIKLVSFSSKTLVTAKEVLVAGPHPRPAVETIVVTLAHLAYYSEKIELEAVFMMCVVAAIDPCQRELVSAVLDNLSNQLEYPSRSKYLDEILGVVLFSWVACDVSVVALVEIRDIFLQKSEPSYFIQYCCPWLLPALILSGNIETLKWVATVAGQSLPLLVRNHFVAIFGICMALHCSKKQGKEKGAVVLRNSILHIAEISEHERDELIKKHMVSIVSFILSLSSSNEGAGMPLFAKDVIVHAIQTVVDGFLDMEHRPSNVGIVDKINIFRADRVFKFIVEIHYKVAGAIHYRHRCHRFSGLEALINIIGRRAAISSTSNYLFNLVGQFIGCHALQDQCCLILLMLLEAFKCNPTKDVICVLGEQLQFLVSKLVSCCIPSQNSGTVSNVPSLQVVSLLRQLIVDADPSLHDYIRELEPFPELDCFDEIREFHQELCKDYSTRDHFLKFVRRTSYLPQRLVLWSLETLHKKLLMGEIIQLEKNGETTVGQFSGWHCEPELVSAVWTLVRTCGSSDATVIRALVADFISRVGIGDPHCVVFHIPGDPSQVPVAQQLHSGGATEAGFCADSGIPQELLVTLVRLLKKYLLDESVSIIDMTSRALRGILSTERGQSALLSLDSYERTLLTVHSKGVNMQLVEKLLSQSDRKSSDETESLAKTSLWETTGKSYEAWICRLVHSLVDYSSDMILRLCQDIVLVKAEFAELIFPHVLVNLARRKDSKIVCESISLQVQEHIFGKTNELNKSIQVMLDALNELRLYHVIERGGTSLTTVMRDSSKSDKPSSLGSRSRSTPGKSKGPAASSSSMIVSTQSWKKVYWLSIDYLLVAKAAIRCGSYLTSVMYVEYWCKEQFTSLTLGTPDFSPLEMLPQHIEILISAVTQINEPDSLYGIIQSYKLKSQIITYEHEGNWSKALEYYDLQVRSSPAVQIDGSYSNIMQEHSQGIHQICSRSEVGMSQKKSYKGLMRSLQRTGCTHVLDLYCQGLTSQKNQFEHDSEFTELQYEAAWRAGNWDFSVLHAEVNYPATRKLIKIDHFNENLHSCLRALKEGDSDEFQTKLVDSKQEVVLSIHHSSKESTEFIYSSIVKLQILNHLGVAWDLCWRPLPYEETNAHSEKQKVIFEHVIPTVDQMELLNRDWNFVLRQTQVHTTLLEPLIAFRRVLLQILNCKDCTVQHLLQSASTLRKCSRFSLAASALHEFKLLTAGTESDHATSHICFLGRLEEAKLLRAQGQHEMAISLAKYMLHNHQLDEEASNVYRLVGKWLAETRSSNSRTILEDYLKVAVELAEPKISADKKVIDRQCQTNFHLAHYSDALFRSYEERLVSNEWQAAMRLRKHKTKELEALIRRLKSSTKGDKNDYSIKIQELQKQLAMDRREAEKLQDDRDNFLRLALEGYQRSLVIGDKYDVRVVFRLVSLWFSLSSRQNVIDGMLSAVKEVQSYKFIPLVYQIASRMGSSKDGQGPHSFQFALVSLVKKMSIDHPYHTLLQLLALANGDRVKDKQRSRNSFVVDTDKKLAAEKLLSELSSHHGAIIEQMKRLVEVYIKLAELETKREDTNKRVALPRDIRSLRQLELVPVLTATFPVDRSCQYDEGSFPHFMGLEDSVMVMNGINAPKVVVCVGSDGHRYRQLAKSGNDDLRQDAVMEQFFGLVNTFLQNNRDTWRRKLGIRTYKVVPFTPSAGVLEWVNGTIPLGDYLLGSLKNGGAHIRYGEGDWSFLRCREYIAKEKDKLKAFETICKNFRPVMHYFFLERFLEPANWFEKRLSYIRSVAASSMVGYIVGLGDRHSMNILVDQATAEVVHIDLGVAFEQGLMLKTPEQVPFRLTRDIIDGMGVTGVDGVFRRCCEETLSVMRTNKEALLTIIEVFIHDPLYKWALSPLKALQLQKETDDDITILEDSQEVYEGNKDAARALMRVKQKLDGYEDGELRSVHGQVQQLIHDAIDPERLCQMFPGWGAWL